MDCRKDKKNESSCKICHRQCQENDMKRTNKGLYCAPCLDEENKKVQLRRKTRKIKLQADPSCGVECDICHRLFVLPYELKNHYEIVHNGVKAYSCDICGHQFGRKADIQRHKIFKHNEVRPFQCGICERSYKCASGLSRHIKTHLITNEFKCDECGKLLKSSRSLMMHKKRHAGEKLFKCKECEQTFYSQTNLNKHILKVHENMKRFLCDLCGAAFFYESTLRRHKGKHLVQVYFKCDRCNKDFKSSHSLKIHTLTIHTPRVESFSCDVCNKTFSHPLILKRHKRRHKVKIPKLSCSWCDSKFVTNTSLQFHLRTHTKVKPFQCDACHKKFRYMFTLNRHYDTFHANPNRVKPMRRYTKWSPEDSNIVCVFFSSYINDLSRPNSKGCLPTKEEIDLFLSTSVIFKDIDIDEAEKHRVIRTKVFNERNKFRQENLKDFFQKDLKPFEK